MENNKKYLIKIPKDTVILYSSEKKIITIIGSLKKKSLKLKLKLEINNKKSLIKITDVPFSSISNKNLKRIKSIQGTIHSKIKQSLIETSYTLYKKLKFVGVGYRAFEINNYKNRLIMFKLGYSHSIYFKNDSDLKIFCLKLTKLFVYGNSYQEVSKTASVIRKLKLPEPYKGKGILYENEKIQLKEGKKI
jgi:large subunit ribosomal protein L6